MKSNNKYPSLQEAKAALNSAAQVNPGNWIPHSEYTALACKNIAEHCPDMDSEKAYILGLLHDIGRYVGIVKEKHQIEGYRYCMERGWDDVAKICLTHCNAIKDVTKTVEKWDVSPEDFEFSKIFVETVEFDDYDRLVQLSDCLAMPTGFCLVEKRFIDVSLRYGVNQYSVEKWKKVIELKVYFDEKVGFSIYKLLPGIIENSFS